MILYDYILSPDCYKVRLLAALTGTKITLRPVDFHPGGEHKTATFLAMNPSGTIPTVSYTHLTLPTTSRV